jgi:hypothetical protein
MRLALTAGFFAMAGALGACALLSGLADYRECVGDCADTTSNPTDGTRVEVPMESGNSLDDGPSLPEGASELEDVGAPPEAGFVDVTLPVDAGSDAPAPPFDAQTDGSDAGVDTGPPPPPGATCGPKGTTVRCTASQICCANLSAQTNACAATCAMNASLSCATASDCPSSAPICCAQATFTIDSKNDPPPVCAVAAFSAACAKTCTDSPPANGCTFIGTLRLCSHDTDCASDTANPLGTGLANQCWNYNGAPESWCTSAAVGSVGGGVHQP